MVIMHLISIKREGSLTALDDCLLGGKDHFEVCSSIIAGVVEVLGVLKSFAGIKFKGCFIIIVVLVVFWQQGIFLCWCILLRFTGQWQLIC